MTWEEIIAPVEEQWRLPWLEICPHRGHPAPAMAIWFARHPAAMTLEQVRAKLGARSYNAVAMRVGRLQRELPRQAELQTKTQVLAKRLNVQC